MSMHRVDAAHSSLTYLSPADRFSFYELADEAGTYAAAALATHADCLELHLVVLRFGPKAVRSLRADVEELKRLAKSLGKTRIAALRTESGLEIDPRWPKFTRMFGFTGQRVYQAAELLVE